MSLIVNGTGIENVIVIKRNTGETVDIELLQSSNGVVIFQKQSKNTHDIILHIVITQDIIDGAFNTFNLAFTKQDTTANTIDWGDGSAIETITQSGSNLISHTYSSPVETDLVISGDGVLSYFGGTSGAFYTTATSGSLSLVTDVLQYYSLGEICDGIQSPLYAYGNGMRSYDLPAYTRNTTVKPYGFSEGKNISKCYYNPNMKNFKGTLPITDPIYQNEDTSANYLTLFSVGDKRIASMGTSFDKTQLDNYNINGLMNGGAVGSSDGENVYPATLKYFYAGSLVYTGSPYVLRFNTPADVQVEMPQAGEETGVAYYKNARQITIYTDNPIIKNYNWAGDNTTATIYHLDGSAW